MKSMKKLVLAGLVLLASVVGLLSLAGCKNDSVPEPTRYTVKFETAHGTVPADITVESGTKLTAEQLKGLADTADYIFEGWYDGETKAEGGTYTVTKDVTLEAKWRDRGTVASIAFTPAGGPLDYGDTVTLSSQEGATIHYTVNDGEEKTGASPVTVSVTGDTTITARATKDGLKDSAETKATYTLKWYTVTFKANGGSEVAPQVVESGQTATRPEPDPTKANWVFAGWYTSADDGETLADTAYSFGTPVAGDITLYAAWNGVGDDGNIVLRNKVMSKTSEVKVLPTGTFQMGSTAGYDDEKPVHGVTISQGYFMGRHEVTQQLYFAVMGKNPSGFKTGAEDEEPKEGLLPVESVSWYDAVVFCNELSELMRLEPVYSKGGTTDTSQWGDVPTSSDEGWNKIECNWNANGYRLPTEAEWEYAARAGDDTINARTWSGTKVEDDLGTYAWFGGSNGTSEVGTLDPNAWGLHDMSGNVWEWCWDWYGNYSTESVTNPTGPTGGSSGDRRIRRGGGGDYVADYCTVSYRSSTDPNYRDDGLGFRLVRSAN